MSDRVDDRIELVRRRADVLSALEGGARSQSEIGRQTGNSRATVTRALDELTATELVASERDGYSLTAAGRVALEYYRSRREGWRDLTEAGPLLARLPDDAPVGADLVIGGDVVRAPSESPYRPFERFRDLVREADRLRALLPRLDGYRGLAALSDHVVGDGDPATLVVPPETKSSLADRFPRRLAAMAGADGFELAVGDPPPFGLVLAEVDGETTVALLVYGDDGEVCGLVANDAAGAVGRAEDLFADALTEAETVTGGLAAGVGSDPETETEGATTLTRGRQSSATRRSLPPALEREGFVALDRSFFAERPVADPGTAWRTGLGIAEVHTGYAVDRTADGDESLRERLVDRLAAGGDCALVGPPGSGKSTTCKQVACEWYESGRGPVLYRERGRGLSLESVGELVDAVEGTGHALVVVEDAVRPEGTAVFDAAAVLTDRDDVSVLVDARRSEWADPPGDASPDTTAFHVESMPPLDERDRERLVQRFERTTGVAVEIEADRLAETVGEPDLPRGDGEGARPGDPLLLCHRLSLYADPLVDDESSLEAEVRAFRESLEDRPEGAVDVAVLAVTLVAAGVPVTVDHLLAAADDPAACESALEHLEGTVLFESREGPQYRTVHESWAVTFLAALADGTDEAAARERFGRAVSALLAVADEPRRLRDAPADGDDREPSGTDDLASRVESDPSGWVEDVVTAVFAMGREHPKLAPLFGDADGVSVSLPAAAGTVSTADLRRWFGEMARHAGRYDAAEAAFEGLPRDAPETAIERCLGLSKVARYRGDFDGAVALAREALEAARETELESATGRALVRLGEGLEARDEYDRAREHYREANELFRGRGDRRWTAKTLHNLGTVAQFRSEYQQAADRYRESLSIRRDVGDVKGEATTLRNLGNVALYRGRLDDAREYYQQALDIEAEVGLEASKATTLGNLGVVATKRSRLERAREYYERSLAIQRDIGDRTGQARTLDNLGLLVRRDEDDLDAAREYHTESLAIRRDIGDRRGAAKSLGNLGIVYEKLDEYERAESHHRESLVIKRDIGDTEGVTRSLGNLAEVALELGEFETARDCAEEALETAREIGYATSEANSLGTLGKIAHERDDLDEAREWFRESLDAYERQDDHEGLLRTLDSLTDLERDADDPEAAREWCERALSHLDAIDVSLPDWREHFENRRDEITADLG